MTAAAEARSEPALATPDVRQRALLIAAWLAPAVAVCVAALRALLSPESMPASLSLAGIAAVLWLGACLAPTVRGIWLDLGAILSSRVAWGFWLFASLLLLLLVASRGAFGAGLAASALLFGAASAREAWRRDRRRFGMGVALLALNLVLLLGVNALIGAFLLPARSHNRLFTEHDPLLGWTLRSGLTATRDTETFSATETINRHGFRTPEIPFEKPPGTQRIVFLGDSHTEGYTVDDAETYTRLVEALLSAERRVEVVSLGVGGYSTDQELLAYLRLGWRYAPDLVVLQFTRNDLPFNVLGRYWRSRKPVFERHGSTLVLTGVPVPDLRATGFFDSPLLQRVPLFLYLEMTLRELAIERDVARDADSEEGWIVTDLLLRDLEAAVARDGARLAVFLASGNQEVEARLQQVLAARGIPYLATRSAYVDDPDSYWVEGHWNQKGQRAIAGVLAPELRALLDSPAVVARPAR